MRLSRLALIPLLVLLGGCNYVHFGKLPPQSTEAPALAQENADLRTEKKILQQELALARKEGETLRATVESSKAGSSDAVLAARLNETTRELATLRESYAKLDAERARLNAASASSLVKAGNSSPELVELNARLSETQEKLAASMHAFTTLREETADLRVEIQQTKTKNAALTDEVRILTAQNSEARAALAQLNTELLAQKDARARASQEADAARSQLSTVLAASRTAAPVATSLGEARTTAAAGASTLATEPATLTAPALPAGDPPTTARLSTSRERLAAATPDPLPNEPLPRTHIVAPGETLEKLAKKFYGSAEKWRILYAANNTQLSLGRPLKVGMVLEVPER